MFITHLREPIPVRDWDSKKPQGPYARETRTAKPGESWVWRQYGWWRHTLHGALPRKPNVFPWGTRDFSLLVCQGKCAREIVSFAFSNHINMTHTARSLWHSSPRCLRNQRPRREWETAPNQVLSVHPETSWLLWLWLRTGEQGMTSVQIAFWCSYGPKVICEDPCCSRVGL